VSNKHYLDKSPNQFADLYRDEPVICKLTDFGESRSLLLQTSVINHAQTANVERGTKPYMAPEIILENRKLTSATLEDLKAIDIWALGLTLFSLLNPDINFPFEREFKSEYPSSLDAASKFQVFLQEKMKNEMKPEPSKVYHRLQATNWNHLEKLYLKYTAYEAFLRPSAQEIYVELRDNSGNANFWKQISLGVSQATPLEDYDRKVAEKKCSQRRLEALGHFTSQ